MDKVKNNDLFFCKDISGTNLICYHLSSSAAPQTPEWRIVLPDAMLDNLVRWYHEVTSHAEGIDRLTATIQRHFYNPRIPKVVREYVSKCPVCPLVKSTTKKAAGQLAPRQAPLAPWHEVHVDSIGNWSIKVNGHKLDFSALTAIDPVTNLLEIAHQVDKKARTSAELLHRMWLCRYPHPYRCAHDGGPEFKGAFQTLLQRAGIKSVPITPATPTANSVIESAHKTIGQVVRTLALLRPPTSLVEATSIIDTAYATAMHATRCASHGSLQNLSPGALVFRRDMHFDIPLIADIFTLHKARQYQIDERLLRENTRRSHHDFKVGESVHIKRPSRAGDQAHL